MSLQMDKLQMLRELEGHNTLETMFEKAFSDSVVPAICMEPGCDYHTEMEPDQSKGYCELCEKNTVQSCLVIAKIL